MAHGDGLLWHRHRAADRQRHRELQRRIRHQWPVSIAPYHVPLVSLANEQPRKWPPQVDQVYADLQAAGIEVLYDDRDERAGVKFNDADLLGLPVRLTMGGKGLKKGIVELKIPAHGREPRDPRGRSSWPACRRPWPKSGPLSTGWWWRKD